MITLQAAALLFDMDGVLVNSLGSVQRSWRKWAAEFGVAGAATLEIPHGMRAKDIVKLLRPSLSVDAGLARIDEIELADLEGVVALPGAARLLGSLPNERWAIATSARRSLMVARLRAADLGVPQHVVTADDVTAGKPNPEPYLRSAQALGFAPADCIVLEDAAGGVRAGVAAGCRVIGVAGTEPETVLRDAGAGWIVRDLAALSAAVSSGGLTLTFQEPAKASA